MTTDHILTYVALLVCLVCLCVNCSPTSLSFHEACHSEGPAVSRNFTWFRRQFEQQQGDASPSLPLTALHMELLSEGACPGEDGFPTSPQLLRQRTLCEWSHLRYAATAALQVYPPRVTTAQCCAPSTSCAGSLHVDGPSRCEMVRDQIKLLVETGGCEQDGTVLYKKYKLVQVEIGIACICARPDLS